ncbi:hypothetical protein E2562_007552 [Oryza meyeriana var. granulata]|uniref:MADS-box domain-containing protein n=1 Tax=Oryza meyeriana var. granulata TaxID=110450 RepID=A0A6G1DV20_9ORYZ|nr:hypothetical protein E2562_007552 [Oryza meyeriana var. granulata]
MPRGKVATGLIADRETRAVRYAKRKEGLMKKARELAELCGIPVAVVCAGPDGGAPDVWVSKDGDGVIDKYLALPPGKRAKHTHLNYLRDQLGKEKDKLARLQQDGPDELAPPAAELDGMSLDELQQLLGSIDATLRATAERREALGLLADDDGADGGRRDADVSLVHHGVPCAGINSVGVHGYQQQVHAPIAPDNGGRLGPMTCNPFHPYNAGVMLTRPGYNNVQYMGDHGVDMNGYQLQMHMPSNGSDNHRRLAWGAFQPCDAAVVQPVYGHLQCWDNNVGGNQIQPAPAANSGWHNPGTWGNDGEPCNVIVPSAGDPYMDTTVADYQTTSTGDNFMDAPVQFLTMGSDESFTNVAGGDETQFSIDELLRCSDATQNSSGLEQLHYLSDLADGFDFRSSYDRPLDLRWDLGGLSSSSLPVDRHWIHA